MLESGQVIGNRYRLEELIGGGGMGSVWRATQIALQRSVAIKFLYARGPRPDIQAERFIHEARIAASVVHRNVVDTIDFGVSDEGEHYMVMSLLQGVTLGNRLEQTPPLSINELVRIVSFSLRGLGAVHDAGIIHRDLKPENIFLVNDPEGAYPKLLDFGISRILLPKDDPRPSALNTREGAMVGTPQYMSPEQVRGIKDLDGRTDIYSMGVILYEALTGRLPFDAEAIGDLMLTIVAGDAPTVLQLRPDVGPELSHIVERAMARNRDSRFGTALEMQKALIEILESTGKARSYPMLSVMPRPNRSSFPPPVKIVGFGDTDRLNLDLQDAGRSEEISLTSLLEQSSEPNGGRIEPVVSPSDFPTPNLSGAARSTRHQLNSLIAAVLGAYTSNLRRYLRQKVIRGRALLITLCRKTAELFRGRYRRWAVASTALAFIVVGGALFILLYSNLGVATTPALADRKARQASGSTPDVGKIGRSSTGNTTKAPLVAPVDALLSPLAPQRYTLTPSQPSTGRTFVLAPNLAPIQATAGQREPTVTKPSIRKRDRFLHNSRKSTKKASLILRHPDF
jgi:serine/threonine protein kinase